MHRPYSRVEFLSFGRAIFYLLFLHFYSSRRSGVAHTWPRPSSSVALLSGLFTIIVAAAAAAALMYNHIPSSKYGRIMSCRGTKGIFLLCFTVTT